MKMIIGLGNPGKKYEHTKHNIGFMTIDALAKRWGITVNKQEMNALTGTGRVGTEMVRLVKPLTFMNDSGRAVGQLKAFYQYADDEILIVQDDMDMAMGRLRLRQRGSAGGHNGIKSIISVLGTQNFYRAKIGIQHPANQKVVDWVLSPFSADEKIDVLRGIDRLTDAAEEWVNGKDFAALMNDYN